MADFTRFISYLYDYRAGERNRNLGFAKMEVRQGVCRLTVRLGHGQVLQQDMMLCGYLTEGEAVYLVRLGEMERGTGERQWRLPADNLGGCGLTLDQLSGLILISEGRDVFLLSVWKDEGRTVEEICRSGFRHERSSRGRSAESSRELWPVGMPEQESSRELWSVGMPEQESSREYRSIEAAVPESSAGLSPAEAETSARQEGATEIDTATLRAEEAGAKMGFQQSRAGRTETETEIETETETESGYHTRYQIDGENDRIAMGKMVTEHRSGQPNVDASAPPEGWRMLCKLYPAARPFEPSAWEVLCISLQDIGRLPPENWVWGNNHFLLHGFYQYHHLILARHRVENRIYLGIPGEFGTNEKFMAAMFGLHQFQRERQGKSDKGYWLTPIRL